MDQETIFTKIIKGKIPSHKVFEDEHTYVFLDIHPLTEGHVLVIPKKPVEFIWDLEPADYQALMATVQKIGAHLRSVLGTPFVGVQVIGVDVPHAHVHVVPFTSSEQLNLHNAPTDEPDHEALAKVLEKVRIEQ